MRKQFAFLSKTRLMSARQCLKRLHLEVHQPDLAVFSSQTESAFATGHEVGDVARHIYRNDQSVLIPYDGGLTHAIRKTERLLQRGTRVPVFEGTLVHGGVLARFDVLLPDANGEGWRLIEVKSSTSVKDEHYFDCAIQSWVFRGNGLPQSGFALAHVDNQYVYQGGDDYRGLLREVDVTAQIENLLPGVAEWVKVSQATADGGLPDVGVGAHCNKPYDCPFMHHCWPAGPYAVQTLPRASKAKLGRWIASGMTDLRAVPSAELSENQRRVQRLTRSGEPELLPAAAEFAAGLDYPRYYLDFETISPAVPRWAGTRPYEVIPIQWSCHYEASAGQVEQVEFLDLTGDFPVRRLAESLIRALGKGGPVLTYSGYERQVIESLVDRFPDLEGPLSAILERLVDLLPVAERNYYHPAMRGSWSLKSLLPCVAPELSYSELEGIQEGTAASKSYLEAIAPGTDGARKAQIREQLLAYCRFDTAAMLRLVQFFAGG